MILTHVKAETFHIIGAKALDPVTVVLIDYGEGKGKLIVECYGSAFATYYNAMGDRTIKQFLLACEPDYIAGRMWPEQMSRSTKRGQAYLLRIVEAVHATLRLQPKDASMNMLDEPAMTKARESMIETFSKVREPLTLSQEMVLAGSLGVWLNWAYDRGCKQVKTTQ